MIASDKLVSEAAGAAIRPALAFADVWAQLIVVLPDDYECHLTCTEADAAAEFLAGHGYPETASVVLEAHARHDVEGDAHYRKGAEDGTAD